MADHWSSILSGKEGMTHTNGFSQGGVDNLWQKYHPVASRIGETSAAKTAGNALSQYGGFLKDHWSTILKDPAQGLSNALENTYSAYPSDRGINALSEYLKTGAVPEGLPPVDMNQVGAETFDMVFPMAGTIAGVGAKTANKAAVKLAQDMKKAGFPDDLIFKQTADEFGQGWWLGHPDTKPRFEIDDSAARYRHYQYTPQEAYKVASQNAMIDGKGFDRIKEMAPYKDMSLKELKAEYKRTGGKIVNAAQSGDLDLAKQLSRDRSGLDGLLGEMSRRDYGPMSNYMSHGELGKAYPDVYKMHTRIDPDLEAQGMYNRGQKGIQGEMISLKYPPQDVIGNTTPYHETQHAIAQREGFARGGSPAMFNQQADAELARDAFAWSREVDSVHKTMPNADRIAAENKLIEQYQSQDAMDWVPSREARDLANQPYIRFPDQFPKENSEAKELVSLYGLDRNASPSNSMDMYRRLADESQARLTQSRMDMTAAERAANPFYKQYDVPLNEMILRYGDGPNAMTGWHGSPHKWDRVDLSKVGTGEGAQAYGHGFYAAEGKGTAKYYADALTRDTPYKFDSLTADENALTPDWVLRRIALAEETGDAKYLSDEFTALKADYADRISKESERVKNQPWLSNTQGLENDLRIIEKLEKSGKLKHELGGHLYELDIPDEQINKMLDWDKPLSEQPESVRKAIETNPEWAPQNLSEWTGGEYYKRLGKEVAKKRGKFANLSDDNAYPGTGLSPDQVQAIGSESLNSLGIPGIRYLDATSRSAGEGTRNFVIFDENIVTPLSRNGEPINAMASLPMDEASRMQRAGEQGFGGDAYHYSRKGDDIKEFTGSKWDLSPFSIGPHVGSKETAYDRFMMTSGGREGRMVGETYPLKIKTGNKLLNEGKVWKEQELSEYLRSLQVEKFGQDFNNHKEANEWLANKIWGKYDSIPYVNDVEGKGTISHMVKPKNIRSRFAAFDTAKKESANILAGAAGAGVALHWSQILNGEDNALQKTQ